MTKPITYFDGTFYDFLSNFHPSPIWWVDQWGREKFVPTVEHAYQAEKAATMRAYDHVVRCRTPGQAKRAGRMVKPLRSGWDELKFGVMERLLVLKFELPHLREQLVWTGDAELIEGNVWHDNIWGDCTCHRCEDTFGQNHLGRMLMKVRQQIMEEMG